MKKILILIVAVALYLHFYPQPQLTQWYENKKQELLNTMSQSTKVTFKSNLDRVKEEMLAEFNNFSGKELANLKTITASLDSLMNFYQASCQGNEGSKLFHPDNLDKVCNKLSSAIASM